MTQRKASPETMARLCEAVDALYGTTPAGDMPTGWCDESKAVYRAVAAYRAETTPPLRSRASVADEALALLQDYDKRCPKGHDLHFDSFTDAERRRWAELAREPTAPDPAPSAEVKRECQDCGLLYSGPECPAHFDSNPLTDHDHDTREERPCGCEEAEALKDQNTELCRLLGHVHGTIAGLVKVLGDSLP